MLSLLSLALVTPSLLQVALGAPVVAKRDTTCVAAKPTREGVAGCDSTDMNGTVSPLSLLTAGNFAALSQTGISAVPAVSVVGDIGVAPAALSYITGFALDQTNGGSYYAQSYMVTGKVYGADSTSSPTPLASNQALQAYKDGSTRDNPSYTELATGTLDTLSLYKGVYTWSTDVILNNGAQLYLNGNKGDVFIFQSSGGFFFEASSQIILSGTLTQDSIYWIPSTTADFGTGCEFYGIVLAHNDITVGKGAALTGHLYSQTEIDFFKNSSLVGPALD